MKLLTKAIVFLGILLLVVALIISFYVEYGVGRVFKKQAIDNLQIIAEQSESAFLDFLKNTETRVLDWSSDSTIRNAAKTILAAPEGSPARARAARDFAAYVTGKKMPFDKTVFLTELLDKNGVIVASTRPERIGKNEKEEDATHDKAYDFNAAINLKFGEVFFGTIVTDEGGGYGPAMHAIVRLFDISENEEPRPIDGVLLVHFSNTKEIAGVFGFGGGVYTAQPLQIKRQTNGAFLENYSTANIYLVNNERAMVTSPRSTLNGGLRQKVDTFPVRECLDYGREISNEYDDYRGARVLGVSMCFQKEGIVMLIEISKDEILAPVTDFIRSTVIGVATAFVLGIIIVILFIRQPLARINDIVLAARGVSRGDFDRQIEVGAKDEIGYLASAFNDMIASVRKLEETRRDLLSLASHQLRTPLSGTKWLIETLQRGIHGPLTEKQGEYLDEIYKINERMTDLVFDMLNVLRVESGAASVKKENVPISSIFSALLETLEPEAKTRRIALTIVPYENRLIHTDPTLFRNIIENLVSNAIIYSAPGKEVFISVERAPAELVFAIKDSGIGIPRDEQRQIFERFYRASNAKTFNTRGTGLGLYIASILAEKIGMTLSFESESGKGSTFYVHLPIGDIEDLSENPPRV